MGLDPKDLAAFRARVQQARAADERAWEATRRLVGPETAAATLGHLASAIQSAPLAPALREALVQALQAGRATGVRALAGEPFKELTGLQPTKAVRALCLVFGVGVGPAETAPVSTLVPERLEAVLRTTRNPYDLLLEADSPSLLDVGAGDLSFAAELVEAYLPRLQRHHKNLTLHSLDRLQPGSKFGGLLHPDSDLLQRFRQAPPRGLQFQFWGGQDMFDMSSLKRVLPRYTLAACHAPATPTFAFEPTRLSPSVIDAHLRKTKGAFRRVRADGEEALEVMDGERALLFPPWKFEIRGPVALLDLLSRKGQVCLLPSVDTEVFWEILSQLVADPGARPSGVILEPALLPKLFGPVYRRLSELPVGESLLLSDLTDLRQDLPRVLPQQDAPLPPYRFRYVEIRRGAMFEGLPASRTARLFKNMTQEAPPWFLILVPAD